MGLISILRVVPIWAYALAAALLYGGWQHNRAREAGAELARHIAETAELREKAMHSALVTTTIRLTKQQGAADAAEKLRRQAVSDAAAANGTADGMRAYAASLAASAAACHPSAAAVGAAASAPGDVLAFMLGRLEEGGRELAAEADRRGIAGSECAERYDALKEK